MLKYYLFIVILFANYSLKAQVQVRDEPRHHNVFENEFIRILDVHLGPNDTTLYHLHNTPSVFILLANVQVGSQLLGGQPEVGANLSGTITYDKISTPRTHKVWNADTAWFHVMDIELTGKNRTEQPVIKNDMLKLLFNEKEVNGYKGVLSKDKQLQLPASSIGYLFVSLETVAVNFKINNLTQHRLMQAGHYIWIEPGKACSISTNSQLPGEFVLLQIK
jgi:hypothetical protein